MDSWKAGGPEAETDPGCGACAFRAKPGRGVAEFLRQASWPSLLVAPMIYSLAVPLVLLDLWMSLYQSVCFPAYGIAKVERGRYLALDRGHLEYLNRLERFNCDYCAYANGVVAFARDVASRTEQYFCPIKHARRCAGAHPRSREFAEYGDAAGYEKELGRLRSELRRP